MQRGLRSFIHRQPTAALVRLNQATWEALREEPSHTRCDRLVAQRDIIKEVLAQRNRLFATEPADHATTLPYTMRVILTTFILSSAASYIILFTLFKGLF